jgi:hypothetical protein
MCQTATHAAQQPLPCNLSDIRNDTAARLAKLWRLKLIVDNWTEQSCDLW